MFFQNSKLAIWNNGSVKVAKDKNIILMYYVDDVDVKFKRVIDSNIDVTVLEEPNDKPWGTRAFAVLDPDGNQINFLTHI